MRDLKLYIVVALLALGAFLYIQYNKPAPVNWNRTYARTDKIPYGTYILHHELPHLFDGTEVKTYRKRLYNTIEDLGNASDGYLLIAHDADIDEPDYRQLIGYLERGNDVLAGAFSYGTVFADSLHLRVNANFPIGDSLANLHFTSPSLRHREYRVDERIAVTHFAQYDTLRATVLATDDQGKAVFLRYRIGDGNLYLLSSPDFFTNYALLQPDGAAFAAQVLSYVSAQHQLIWDDYQTLGSVGQQSPMRVFLGNEHLRPAYLIALFSLLAFVLFGVKRRQRVIPVIEPLKNTSIEFAQVVSSLYYQQRDNRDILAKQYTYFLERVRTAYRLDTHESDPAFVQRLSARSGVAEATVLRIVQGMGDVRDGKPIDDKTLVTHYRHLENFYQSTLWKNSTSNNARISVG